MGFGIIFSSLFSLVWIFRVNIWIPAGLELYATHLLSLLSVVGRIHLLRALDETFLRAMENILLRACLCKLRKKREGCRGVLFLHLKIY